MFKEAYQDVLKQLGGRKAKAFLVCDNVGASGEIAAELAKLLPDTPYAGLASNWDEYLPIQPDTLGQAVDKPNGVVVTAITGEVDVELEALEGLTKIDVPYPPAITQEEWQTRWEQQKPAHAAKGEELVKKFTFPKDAGLTTIFMVSGTMHTPREEYVFEGVRKALPDNIKLIGGAGSDFANIYWKGFSGKAPTNALYGMRISGKFQAVTGGAKGGGQRIKTSLPEILTDLTKQLNGAKPTAAIYFGCASWNAVLPEQQEILQKFLPKGVGVYGQYCGGEMGALTGQAKEIPSTGMGVLMLMAPRASATTAPAATQAAATQAAPAGATEGVLPTRAVSDLVLPSETTSPFLTEADFVTDWLVLGPFTFGENDFGGGQQQDAAKKEFMPAEAALDGTQKAPAGAEWKEKRFTEGTQAGQVDLDGFYSSIDHAAAYAVAWLYCPAAIENAKLLVGSDDYITVWLNGQQILSYSKERRGSDWDQDKATVRLKKGYNRVVVKCVNVVSGWDFYFRLADAEDLPLAVKPRK